MHRLLTTLKQAPIIPVYYHDDIDSCIATLEACYAGGIRIFEFVNRGTYAERNFDALLQHRDTYLKDLQLGIGTIKTAAQAAAYIKRGADFIVSPIVTAEIAAVAKQHSISWIPGCMTPTEISMAEVFGAPLIKLFPGDSLKPNFLKAIKPLFPDLKFMPTGGVDITQQSINEWKQAGVSAIGMGSKLFDNPENTTDLSWLSRRCNAVLTYYLNSAVV